MFEAYPRWRREIDTIIESRLLAAGFERFDGISYSFTVSEDILGVVHIANQAMGSYPSPETAIIYGHFGFIHFQLGVVYSKLEQYSAPWGWTLRSDDDHIGPLIAPIHLTAEQPLKEKERTIEGVVDILQRERVPYIRANFNKLQQICEFEATTKFSRDEEKYCIALVMTGKTSEGKRRADWISANLSKNLVHIGAWPGFKLRFEQWLRDGAPVPTVKEARKATFDAAFQRAFMVRLSPPGRRPSW